MSSQESTILKGSLIAFAFAMLLIPFSSAQTYTVIHRFTGAPDGNTPYQGVLQDSNGNLYGTTFLGGNQNCASYPGCGTVYKIDSQGKEIILHNFGLEGGQQIPPAPYIDFLDEGSNLYGATVQGGEFGLGSAFALSPSGGYKVVHNFTGGAQGLEPGLFARDASGNLYGTTVSGGNSTQSGVLFRLNPSGKESVLYTYNCPECDGQNGVGFGNSGGLIVSGHTLYGVAAGGTTNSGVVYKIDFNGQATVLYNFQGGTDGWDPEGPLVRDSAGNLYGVTANPDGSFCSSDGCGNVFKIDPQGNETVLFTFQDGPEGGHPNGGLVRDSQGNLYGTTWNGGSGAKSCGDPYGRGCGVVFKIDPSGNETVLYTFLSELGGGYPNGDLIMDSSGNLYGTTTSGGNPKCKCGVVFRLTP